MKCGLWKAPEIRIVFMYVILYKCVLALRDFGRPTPTTLDDSLLSGHYRRTDVVENWICFYHAAFITFISTTGRYWMITAHKFRLSTKTYILILHVLVIFDRIILENKIAHHQLFVFV